MEWTQEQRKAIETTGKNLLVSAAAGSGKTTVLVARIKKLVIEDGVGISKFLITTYTKAAADEMKGRLEEAIKEELKKPGADKAMLTEQLRQLPGASISTFHAFAIEIVRQYFYLTDLEPGFAVADNVQVEIMRQKALDEVFEKRYEEDSEEFKEFILKYSSSNGDNQLKKNIFDTYNTLMSIPNYMEEAYEKAEALKSESPTEAIGAYILMAETIADNYKLAIRNFEKALDIANANSLPSAFEGLSTALERLQELSEAIPDAKSENQRELRNRITALATGIANFKVPTIQWKKDGAEEDVEKILKKRIEKGKKHIKEIFEICSGNYEAYDAELKDMYEDTIYYLGLIKEFDEAFRKMKLEDNVVDFNDLMHYSISILNNEEAANQLKEKFEYIFVDEYQDSNSLQEEIIGRIARDNNLFLVGDVKQCIYKFRLAEPKLFTKKAELYGREDERKSMLLNINSNFRSKKNVTEPVNDIFRKVMPGYEGESELNCTAPPQHPGFPARLHVIGRENAGENAPDKGEAEAALVAKIIRERLGTEIYDTKRNEYRQLTLRDFAVITRNNRVVEEIERYLINDGIAAYGEGSGNYFETVEVQVFLNLLRVIDNMRQDVPLISAMKSVVFGFTVPELVRIRLGKNDETYYSAVMEYVQNGSDGELRDKIRRMIDTITLWKEISRTLPLEELMKVILYDTGYYDYCSGLPVGTQRISNLRLIAEKAAKYEGISHGGLYGFLKYIESMQNVGQNDSEAKIISENEDVVRVMTVHKSKGLEFPVVIFTAAAKGTKPSGHSYSIKIHRDIGIGLPMVNREEHFSRKTFLQKVIDMLKEKEVLDEEIRILYVALTRAKDGLEIIGTVDDAGEEIEDISTGTFLDMIYVPFVSGEGREKITYNDFAESENLHFNRRYNIDELFEKAKGVTDKRIDERLSYVYPYEKEGSVKPKYSVSEMNRVVMEAETGAGEFGVEKLDVAKFEPETEPINMATTERKITAARRGTVMHMLMEKLDFIKARDEGIDYIRSVADMLLAEEIINAEEYDAISIKRLLRFFETDIGRRGAEAFAAGKLFREKEFIMNKEIDGTTSIVQGVIDCWFEENEKDDADDESGIVLIDYKSNYISGERTPESIAQSYTKQIDLYREALEGATGKKVKEAYLFLFSTGEFVEM